MERAHKETERQVGEIVKADEIAAEVAKRVNRDRRFTFTVGQRVGAALVGGLLVAQQLHDLGVF